MSSPIFLLATLLALASGPALYAQARSRPRMQSLLDGAVLVGITGLIVLDVVPETWRQGGAWSLAFIATGLFGPTLLERAFRRVRHEAHLGALGLATGGLVL